MDTIKWGPIYSMHIEEIDEQHKRLIKIIDKVYNSIYSGQTEKQLRVILQELKDFGKVHFDTEEKYFDKFDYENKKEHVKEHTDFKKKIDSLLQDTRSNDFKVSIELAKFLDDWLIDHLMTQDKKYVDCFLKNGLS